MGSVEYIYLYWLYIKVVESIGNNCRGEVSLSPIINGHILYPSTGGKLCSAALVSVGSTPNNSQKVTYQSAMWNYPSSTCPLLSCGNPFHPPLTTEIVLTPPSHGLSFAPRNGSLFPPQHAKLIGPPSFVDNGICFILIWYRLSSH